MRAETDITPQPQTGWKSPLVLLILMAVAMQLSHQTWFTLLNNFAIQKAHFSGREIGILQSLREIPGFLAFGVIFVLLLMKEQTLAYLALVALGIGTALTGYFPYATGFYATTMLMSLGFHYYETVNQSLALQWLKRENAPEGLGKIASAASLACLAAYGLVYLSYSFLGLSFQSTYLLAGLATIVIVIFVATNFPYFPQHVPQNKNLVFRRNYWLYYALVFMGGARRQIFVVFAGFLMVEKFGYSVTAITTLFLINHIFTMFMAPRIGRLISRFGERAALTLEYIGLACVFTAYAFVSDPWIAAGLYITDHAFFAMAIAQKTYFQKIADPSDIAPTAGVAFSINHIAAVFLPVLLGMLWLAYPPAVFLLGTAMALISLLLARLVPQHPSPEQEYLWPARPQSYSAH